MAFRADDHVFSLTALLSAVSLALVFAAVLGVIPAGLLPYVPAAVAVIPHLNAIVSLLAIVLIVGGWWAIRRGDVRRHRLAMGSAAALFAAFLLLYLYKVVMEGPAPFLGPPAVYRYLYLPLLAVHMLLAMVCIPLLYYVLLIGLTHPVSAIPRTAHPRVGRIAAPLWLTSFGLGEAVYALLYVVY